MGLMSVTKWGVKLGAVGGTSYLAYQENLFGSQAETRAAWAKLKDTTANSEVAKMLPEMEMPKELTEMMPAAGSMEGYKSGARQTWNSGVLATFDGITQVPSIASGYASQAWEAINDQAAAAAPAAAEGGEKKKKKDN